MERTKTYYDTRFSADVLKDAIDKTRIVAESLKANLSFDRLSVDHDDSEWKHDNFDEFLGDFRKYQAGATVSYSGQGIRLYFSSFRYNVTVSVECSNQNLT
jgi:hypothetical protein